MLTDKERADIRRKLMELSDEPPANAWKAIHAEIKPKRRWRFAWWITGAVLLLLTTAGVLYIMNDKTEQGGIPTVSVSQPETESSVPATIQPAQPNVTQPQANAQPDISSLAPDQQSKQSTTGSSKELPPLASNTPGKSLPSGSVSALNPKNAPGKGKDNVNMPLNAVLEDKDKATPVLENKENLKERNVQVRPEMVAKPQISQPGQTLELPSNETTTEKKSPENAESIHVTGNTPGSTANTVIAVQPGQTVRNEKPTENSALPSSEEKYGSNVVSKPQNTEDTKSVLFNRKTIASIPSRVLHANEHIHELTLDSVSLAVQPRPEVQPSKESIIIPERRHSVKEWTMGVFFSPRYAFRVVTPASSDDIYITGLNQAKPSGADRMGYEAGVSLSKTVGRNLYLETSLAFMQLKENLSYNYTSGVIDTLLRTVSPDGKQVDVKAVYITANRQLISSYAYGGWRMGATYYFWQNQHRRFNFTLNGGVNLLVKGQTREIIDGQESKTIYFPSKENILEQTNYNLQVGAGYSVRVMQKYELMLMPTLNYFLGSTFKTREPFGLKPYSLGIHIQLKRRFPL
jgi:hypothetical protein